MTDDSTRDWHREKFAEFCLYEMATGGPDPHMRYIGEMSRGVGFAEQIWRVGLYVAFYNVPTAEVVWKHWPWHAMWSDLNSKDPMFPVWLAAHWPQLTLRKEARARRTIQKMNRVLSEYALWTQTDLKEFLSDIPEDGHVAFEELWKEAEDGIPYFGRYAISKMVEAYRRFGVKVETPDIRARGGWSPRTTLNMITGFDIDVHDDRKSTVAKVDSLARDGLAELNFRLGYDIDYFRYEVMLCEYHESYHSKRQYPGRSHDSELKYAGTIAARWNLHTTDMWRARASIAPQECLGESGGWIGTREDLGGLLSEKGYTWSDLLYRYPSLEARHKREDVPNVLSDINKRAMRTMKEDLFD